MENNCFEIDNLLRQFIDLVNGSKEDRISFLNVPGNEAQRDAVLKAAMELKQVIEDARKKAHDAKNAGGVGQTAADEDEPELILDIYEVHMSTVKLWEALISAALSHISPSAKGNSTLFGYLKEATKFEDLLYGLDPYYRDHTVHSLWVYLIGLNLMNDRSHLHLVANNLNWYIFNDVTEAEHDDFLVRWAALTERFLIRKLNEKRDAIWCIMALCHDLGYSIAKLSDLNESVQKVLAHYDVSNLSRIGYSLDIEHQYLVEQFLELMAMEVRIVPRGDDITELDKKTEHSYGEALEYIRGWNESKAVFTQHEGLHQYVTDCIGEKNGQEFLSRFPLKGKKINKFTDYLKELNSSILIQSYRDDNTYWRLCKALEKKEHGIISAYLLFKKIELFADTYIRGAAEEWGLEDAEAKSNAICGGILFGIAQHQFAFADVSGMGSLAEILILCDELEEFSRYGRELQSRKYTHTTARTNVKFVFTDEWLSIAMTYVSVRQKMEDFRLFCLRKAERMCQLFSLESKDERDKDKPQDRTRYPIKAIQSTFIKKESKNVEAEIGFSMSNESRYYLLSIRESGGTWSFAVECRDDKLHVQIVQKKDGKNERKEVADDEVLDGDALTRIIEGDWVPEQRKAVKP